MGDEVKRKCDLAYLFAAPLWGNLGVKLQETIIKPLDFQKEQKDLFETLSNSEKVAFLSLSSFCLVLGGFCLSSNSLLNV